MFLAPGCLESGAAIEDVQFSYTHDNILGSVDDNGNLLMYSLL